MPSARVSVFMISFNHECYIAQAIKSVLEQKCSFPVEIVLGDDCSTDRTLSIARDIAADSPIPINILRREHNLGMMGNMIETYSACTGEYVAFLEGDDYWIDSSKLQRQVDLMDSRKGHSLCFHQAKYVDASGNDTGIIHPKSGKPVYGLIDLMESNPIQTNTILVRRSAVSQIPEFFRELRLGDWPLCILAARAGEIAFIPDVMAAYRLHSSSAWSSKPHAERIMAEVEMFMSIAANYPDLRPLVTKRFAKPYQDAIAIRSSLTYRIGRLALKPALWLRGEHK